MANGENRSGALPVVAVDPNLPSIAKAISALIVRQQAVETVLVQLVKMETESNRKRDALSGLLAPLALRSGLVPPEKLKEALNA